MTLWSLFELYNRYVRNVLVRFFCIKDIYLSFSIYVKNICLLYPLLFIIRIHVIFHLGLLSIIVISHVRYDSIIIIIDVHLVIFNNGAWIFPRSNIINDNSIPPPICCHATPSHNNAMIVASLLWITFVYKIRGRDQFLMLIQSAALFYWCAISFHTSCIPGRIRITRRCPFACVIIF